MRDFGSFIGVDWSGNGQRWQRGLQVAIAEPGSTAPILLRGQEAKGRWSRNSFADWLGRKVREQKTLVGLDFAFGFPDVASVVPELKLNWQYVAEFCRAEANFYGGRFFKDESSPHAALINSRTIRGTHYSHRRLRATEIAAKRIRGATPSCVFNAVGAAQVGPSSISGMRFLDYMSDHHGSDVAVWPFDEINDDRSVIVEVFPRFFPLSKNLSSKLANHAALNSALEAFGSVGVATAPKNEDEGDALLTAAALRQLSREPEWFNLPPAAVRNEGWIFGVPLA
jgi:hypothetical protein